MYIKLKQKIKQDIQITWKDIVYFENKKHVPTYESSTMQAVGNLYEINPKFVILKDANNTRSLPTFKNHPDYKVKFYIIPIEFIIAINVLSTKTS